MRLAKKSDALKICQLYLSARKSSLGSIPPVFGGDERITSWLSRRIESGEECWITEDMNGITAFMLLEPGWLDQLYVRPDKIGQGLGTQLLDKAKELMPGGIKLWTFQSNVRAHKFYERNGFVPIKWTDGADNEEGEPDVCYEWNCL